MSLQERTDLFKPAHIDTHYSLQNYHIMGSRILSRCFRVEKWEGDDQANDNNHSQDGMEVDEGPSECDDMNVPADDPEVETEIDEDIEDEDEEAEDPSDVAMVPMADMLNARYGSENVCPFCTPLNVTYIFTSLLQAKLFHEVAELNMITTKDIKAGEQIVSRFLL